jgi:hypothetical protein
VTGRHKGELALDVSQRRPGQALDERLAVEANALLVYDKQVEGRAEAEVDLIVSRRLHDFGRHAVPREGTSLDDIGWEDFNCMIDCVVRVVIGKWPGQAIAPTLAFFAQARVLEHRQHHRGPRRPRISSIERHIRVEAST